MLRRNFPGQYRFRFATEGRISDHSTVLLDKRKTRTEWSRRSAWDLKKSKLNPERKWEIECLRREIRNAPNGFIICVTAPVFVEDITNNSAVAEFDGVFLRLHGSKAELNIIEAKTNHTGAHRAAVSELKAKMIRLGVSRATVDQSVRKLEKSSIISLCS